MPSGLEDFIRISWGKKNVNLLFLLQYSFRLLFIFIFEREKKKSQERKDGSEEARAIYHADTARI